MLEHQAILNHIAMFTGFVVALVTFPVSPSTRLSRRSSVTNGHIHLTTALFTPTYVSVSEREGGRVGERERKRETDRGRGR